MPRYHFELANGHRLPDPEGPDYTSDQDAKAKIARQIQSLKARRQAEMNAWRRRTRNWKLQSSSTLAKGSIWPRIGASFEFHFLFDSRTHIFK
jgi:hypothetical protein